MAHMKTDLDVPECAEIVIIGNGPSAISTSYVLSGNWPYWSGRPHPNEFLTERLGDEPDTPLLLQDLPMLSEGLEGRSTNPVSLLWDQLQRPDTDTGVDSPSVLEWRHLPQRAVSHVVLGSGPPGGSWQSMSGDMETLSMCGWMELPNLPFKKWLQERGCGVCGQRARVRDVQQYYTDYVKLQGIESNFRSWCHVTSVTRLPAVGRHTDAESGESCSLPCCDNDGLPPSCSPLWEVRGVKQQPGESPREFAVLCQKVVLAVGGNNCPNKLSVPGEELPFVQHSLYSLDSIHNTAEDADPVLVVGAGLSAADAVLHLLSRGISVKHAYRGSPTLSILTKLSPRLYPEYSRVLRLMKGEEAHPLYTPIGAHTLTEIWENRHVLLEALQEGVGSFSMRVSAVFILIGSRPDLSFLPHAGKELGVVPGFAIDGKHNPMDADPFTFESNVEPGLYACGPLVGDTFVRFVQGCALGIVADVASKKGWKDDGKMEHQESCSCPQDERVEETSGCKLTGQSGKGNLDLLKTSQVASPQVASVVERTIPDLIPDETVIPDQDWENCSRWKMCMCCDDSGLNFVWEEKDRCMLQSIL